MIDILLKLLVIVVILFILYISFSTSRVKEGLTNATSTQSWSTTSSTSSGSNGLAGNAAAYASNISSEVTKLNDALLTSKYNTDYVNVVNELKDYINAQALEAILNISPTDLANNDISSTIQTLNSYSGAQTSLSNILSYLSAN